MAWYDKLGLGIKVERPAAPDPQNVFQSIFTITGGPIIVMLLLGIRTIIQGGGASNIDFQHSAGPTSIAAVGATSATDAVGTKYLVTGAFLDPVQIGLGLVPLQMGRVVATALFVGPGNPCGFLADAGNIQVRFSQAGATGSTRYVMYYDPVSPATVVAA